MQLNRKEKETLISVARQAIINYIDDGRYDIDTATSYSNNLNEHCGAFVSIYVNSDLRGCIGTFSEDDPVYKSVHRMAIASVSSDSRFKPITKEELDRIDLEVSILSPRRLIEDISEIELGKHGIYLKKGSNKGTFLPHVAIDQKWTREEYLGHCAKHKAGIGWEGWKTSEIYIYEAIVINS